MPNKPLPIEAFADKTTKNFVNGIVHRKLRHVQKQIQGAIRSLETAPSFQVLGEMERSCHPVTHEKLITQKYAIDITDKYRLCFDWKKGDKRPSNIQITDHYKPI